MDKAEIMEEKNSFKKISVVPGESDLADVIVANMVVHPKEATLVSKRYSLNRLNRLRQSHKRKIWSEQLIFADKLFKVSNEFPRFGQMHRPYVALFYMRYKIDDYSLALSQVIQARNLIFLIAREFMRQLVDRDDCDSLEKCKSLKVSALACMYTVAMRCLPSLDYLEQVRQYMASLTESNLEEDDIATYDCSTLIKYDTILDKEDCTVPFTVDVHNLAGFASPEVLRWLDDMELEYGFRLVEDDQLDRLGCH